MTDIPSDRAPSPALDSASPLGPPVPPPAPPDEPIPGMETATDPAWESLAEFVLAYQTRQVQDQAQYQTTIRHPVSGQHQTWAGLEAVKLQGWIRAQLAGFSPDALTRDSEPAPIPERWFTPVITNLILYQPVATKSPMSLYQPNLMFPSPVQRNQPFQLEVQFQIQEQEAFGAVQREVGVSVGCYARNFKKSGEIVLAELPFTALDPKGPSYQVELPAITLQTGIYRLQVLLNVHGVHAYPALIEVPALQVA